MLSIQTELKKHFQNNLIFCNIENTEAGEQFCFLKALIKNGANTVKLEALQNFQHLDALEVFNQVRIFSVRDIGLFKLMSASNRFAKKDIYDLDYITDQIPLSELLERLKQKSEQYHTDEFKCLFDLDHEKSPVDNLHLLLAFDNIKKSELSSKPSHTNDILDIVASNKTWNSAKSSWRRKVKSLMKDKGIFLPPIKPIN